MSEKAKKRGAGLALMGAVLAISGCTVQPSMLSLVQHAAIAEERAARIVGEDQEPVTAPIDLYEAMARALKYNLDHRIELKEEALRYSELKLSRQDMLPKLVANASYTNRSNEPGASSISLLTGQRSLVPSRSTQREVASADLTLSWDVLDFGLSYVRAQQNADKVLIAAEQRRSAMNRIIEDVRTSYWRAVSAERLLKRLTRLQGDVEKALRRARRQVANRAGPMRDALVYQRQLLLVVRSAQELRRDLRVAKSQLAALMNLRQGEPYDVVVPKISAMDLPIVNEDAEHLARTAFVNRPELREMSYRLRINDKELKAGLLEALPSLKGLVGANVSSNDLLFNMDWVSVGAKAAWNIMRLARYPQRKRTIEAAEELLDARALALTQAVATQVFVSKARVVSLKEELHTAKRLARVNREMSRQTQAAHRSGAATSREEIQERMNAIVADLRRDIAYADLQNAYANLYASIGLDIYAPHVEQAGSVQDTAAALRKLWFERGDAFAGKQEIALAQ